MSFLELIWMYVLVFLLSAVPFFEAYAVIPIAIIGGLSFLPSLLIGLIGNIFTVFLLIAFINQIKKWRKGKSDQKSPSKRSIRAKNLWKKYGLPGLAMIGPLFVGSHLTTFMSLSLGGGKKQTLYWIIASITTWSLVFSILAFFGVDLLGNNEDGFIHDFFR